MATPLKRTKLAADLGFNSKEEEEQYLLNNTTLSLSNPLSSIRYQRSPNSVMTSIGSRRSDIISSAPRKRQMPSMSSQQLVQPTLIRPLTKSLKGIGFIKPGSPFDIRPRVLSHEFAFDLAASVGQRACCFTLWRHGFGGYSDSDASVLSPDKSGTSRTVDGVVLNTAIRNGSPGALPYGVSSNPLPLYLASSTSLWDLELASWNANPLKLLHDPGSTTNTTFASVPATGNVIRYVDVLPDTDHNYATPFPWPPNSGPPAPGMGAAGAQGANIRPPFLVNLGPGSVSFACQNKVPTSAEVEFVVYQIRDVQTSVNDGSNFITDHIAFSNTTYASKNNGPVLTSSSTGSGGKGYSYSNVDCLNDPDFKFLATYPRYSTDRSPLIEKDRIKFVLKGGSLKTVKFQLPAQIYESGRNALVSGDPFATTTITNPGSAPGVTPVIPATSVTTFTPTVNAAFNTMTYIIAVAVNGVVMPVFTYPLSNNTNSVNTQDSNNISVVDRQSAFASVLFSGSYVEHPMACLSTPQLAVYNNKPMLDDTEITDTTTFGFCTGYVAPMPVAVASGNTVVFSQLSDTLVKRDNMET